TDFPAFWEAVLSALLVASAIFLHATNWERVREIDLFALVLLVQSLPFLASAGLATLEGSRVNDFAFWRGLEAKVAALRPHRAALAQAPATTETPVENVQ
ncbi:MAG: glycosyl transferase family 2, partial [Xanthobacteraceae bacterium]